MEEWEKDEFNNDSVIIELVSHLKKEQATLMRYPQKGGYVYSGGIPELIKEATANIKRLRLELLNRVDILKLRTQVKFEKQIKDQEDDISGRKRQAEPEHKGALKNRDKEPWLRAHKLQTVAIVIAMTALGGFIYVNFIRGPKTIDDNNTENQQILSPQVREAIITELNMIEDHAHNIDFNEQYNEKFKLSVINKIQGASLEVPVEVNYLRDMINELAKYSRAYNNKMILQDYLCISSFNCECKNDNIKTKQTDTQFIYFGERENVATGSVVYITSGYKAVPDFNSFPNKTEKEQCESVFKLLKDLKGSAKKASDKVTRL